MPLDILLGTETAGYTVVIDGRTYRPLKVDSEGGLTLAELAAALVYATAVVPTNVETTILTITGKGFCQWFQWACVDEIVYWRVYVDGTKVFEAYPYLLNAEGSNKTTYPVALFAYTVDGACGGVFGGPWHFKTSFAVRIYHTTGVNQNVYINRGVCSIY